MSFVRGEKQLRVQMSRSHSGCRTCKQRRVKCDECAPRCQKCTKSNRICLWDEGKVQENPFKMIIYATRNPPAPFPVLSHNDLRAWEHFQHRTSRDVMGPFNSPFWSSTILRLAQEFPAVKHALLALSIMHEKFCLPEKGHPSSHQHAMHHYNIAIRQIVRVTDSESSWVGVLLTCIMFCAIESLRGNFSKCLQHARSGMKIAEQVRQEAHSGQKTRSVDLEMLDRTFTALQNQIMRLGDSSTSEVFQNLHQKFGPVPQQLESVEEAQTWLEILLNEVMAFLNDHEPIYEAQRLSSGTVNMSTIPKFCMLRQRVESWSIAVNNIESRADINSGTRYQAFLILKIYQSILKVLLEALLREEDVFDTFNSELAGALKLAEVFLQLQGSSGRLGPHDTGVLGARLCGTALALSKPPTVPTFSMSMGVIPVLVLVSIKSNKPEIRDEALRLLRCSNRREGIWDSKWASDLANRIIERKKQFDPIQDRTGQQRRLKILGVKFGEKSCIVELAFAPAPLFITGTNGQNRSTKTEYSFIEVIDFT